MAGRYRKGITLNCQIGQELSDKLADYSARTGLPKTAIVCQALQNHFHTMEVQAAVIEKLKSDPAYVAQLAQALQLDAV